MDNNTSYISSEIARLNRELREVKKILKLYQEILESHMCSIEGAFCSNLNKCKKSKICLPEDDQKKCLNKKLLLNREVLKKLSK